MVVVAGTIDIDRTIMEVAGRRAGVCSELSRFTAARLQNYPVDPSIDRSIVDVAAPHGFNRRVQGVAIHRRRRPTPPHDLIVVDGLPVTGPALTIVDLAAVVTSARLRHIVQTQVSAERPSLDELIACVDSVARRGVKGITSLRLVMAPMIDETPVPASMLERAVAVLLAEQRIVGFRAQYRPPWYDGIRGVVDFAHPG